MPYIYTNERSKLRMSHMHGKIRSCLCDVEQHGRRLTGDIFKCIAFNEITIYRLNLSGVCFKDHSNNESSEVLLIGL